MAITFLIWKERERLTDAPSSCGNHLPNLATTFLIWQEERVKERERLADAERAKLAELTAAMQANLDHET